MSRRPGSGRPAARRRPLATAAWPIARRSAIASFTARSASVLASSEERRIRSSAAGKGCPSAAWNGCLGVFSERTTRRRRTAIGSAGEPATATSAAQPECARKPSAAPPRLDPDRVATSGGYGALVLFPSISADQVPSSPCISHLNV